MRRGLWGEDSHSQADAHQYGAGWNLLVAGGVLPDAALSVGGAVAIAVVAGPGAPFVCVDFAKRPAARSLQKSPICTGFELPFSTGSQDSRKS